MKTITELFKELFNNDSIYDVYNYKYSYDEMKIMYLLPDKKNLTYEDMCWIAHCIYELWNTSYESKFCVHTNNKIAEEILEKDDFYQIQTREEEGYSQAYVNRVADKIIKEYLKTTEGFDL